jgi:uncharacterized protein
MSDEQTSSQNQTIFQDQMPTNQFTVDVIYTASADQIKVVTVSVTEGATLFDTVLRSGIVAFFPEIDVNTTPMGVFGKIESKPKTRVLQKGERIEIYRPLLVDPKISRQKRAEKIRQAGLAEANIKT